jgi:hypothetical protein
VFIFQCIILFHSHSSLWVVIVRMCLPWLSNISIVFPLVYMVGAFAIMSLFALHSLISNFMYGRFSEGCMNLVSFCCDW